VRGDREHLRAMVLCLLLNAGGHSLPGRTISVSVWCHGDSAHLSVLDRGAGALPVENEISFQPFRRLEAAPQVAPYLDENGEWWLSLAARIAYAHGGDILLGGTPGLGSEVDVRLPCVAATVPDNP
jgi:signal transduction histidine kinase